MKNEINSDELVSEKYHPSIFFQKSFIENQKIEKLKLIGTTIGMSKISIFQHVFFPKTTLNVPNIRMNIQCFAVVQPGG